MSSMWLLGFVSTAVGIGIGGLLAWLLKGFQKSIDTIYALCSGLILGLMSLEIIPAAIQLGDWIIFFLGFLAGILLFELLHTVSHKITLITNSPEKDLFIHTGFLLSLSIAVHNFPLGMILGSSDSSMSTSLLHTLILHNVPEGMILFTPLFLAGLGFYTWFWFSVLVAVPVGIGSFVGSLIGINHPFLWAFTISLTAGIIFMVTIKEILRESTKHSSLIYCLVISMLGFICILIYFAII
ncbi:ZIP family metal transporter [Jeotgalibacillus marinus]|uniref:ZIP family metal transporter n=1 Tax=Jeotgalibacillus marinus TaxID=86667 RepID=A0ABV3Q5Z5_9BACL